MADIRRLNLGCGTDTAAGWFNLDGSWGAWLAHYPRLRRAILGLGPFASSTAQPNWRDDLVIHDVRRRLPFSAQYFDAIYASHLLEHLYRDEADRLLAECSRVLKPRGILRVVVPDLEAIVQEYLGRQEIGSAHSSNGSENKRRDACERFNERLMFHERTPPQTSLLRRLYSAMKNANSHKWVYDSEHLLNLLHSAGFESVKRCGYRDSQIPGIGEVERPDRILNGEGICLEGRRPLGTAE